MSVRWNAVSADSHIESSPVEWADRLPAHLRDQGPTIGPMPDGAGHGWMLPGMKPVALGLSCTGGLKYAEFKPAGRPFDAKLPGAGGPDQRIAEQDQDGTDGELLFASPFVVMLKAMTNPELVRESCRAYNNWISEYCSAYPERLFGAGLIPHTNITDAIAELEHIAGLPNVHGAHILVFPAGGELLNPADDAFWQAAQDLNLCIIGHHNFGGRKGTEELEVTTQLDLPKNLRDLAHFLKADLVPPSNPVLTLIQLIAGGVLDRFPGLRFHFAETGIGWLPYWLEQIEDRYDRNRFWAGVDLSRRPAEYIRDHFTFSFQEDHAGVRLRDMIGVDVICWASDFPHSVSDWPFSRETRARLFADVPDDERRKIEALNILCQLGVISREEKESMARVPRDERAPELVAARGERRL